MSGTKYRYKVKFYGSALTEVFESSPGALIEAAGVTFYPPNKQGWRWFPIHMFESIERLPEDA